MLIIYQYDGKNIVVSISEASRLPDTIEQHLVDPQPDGATELVYEDVSVSSETDAQFHARMVAAHVPSGSPYLINPTLPDGIPPERFSINWQAGSISLAAPTAAEMKAYASNKRWEIEVFGVLVGGMLVPTDDRSKAMIARAARTSSGVASTPFIVSGLNYGSITKAQFEAIDAAIDDHIASTFSKLATILAGIDAAEITTREQIDAAFA
jgi:hypothetical protein